MADALGPGPLLWERARDYSTAGLRGLRRVLWPWSRSPARGTGARTPPLRGVAPVVLFGF